jgi:hypothetical protein
MSATYTLLASTTLTSATNTVTFSNFNPNGAYRFIVIKTVTRCDGTATATMNMTTTPAMSSGNNYNIQNVNGTITGVQNTASVYYPMPTVNANATASVFANNEILIFDGGRQAGKNITSFGGNVAVQPSTYYTERRSKPAGTLNALTAITLTATGTGPPNFVVGSSFYIYGIANG